MLPCLHHKCKCQRNIQNSRPSLYNAKHANINIYFKSKTCLLSRIKCIVYSYLNKGVPCRVVCI